ncbi:MAG: uridine phosphorylase [Deltaproteobacteria bacterium]|nr:uridine phosphorylase [Deltaproteobacteria bacterium]
MSKAYHLDLKKSDIKEARIAIMPGDPFRVPAIAIEISKKYKTKPTELAWKREFRSFLAPMKNTRVVICSTGIGSPSTSIAIEELAQLGIETFIRLGTTGSIQSNIKMGDVIITTASVRLDGASRQYAPIEYPAVSDLSVTNALVSGAKRSRVNYHTGVTASTDTFFQGEERNDSYRKYTIRDLRGSTKEWKALGVLNYEMESSIVLTMTSSMGLKGGCITGVVNKGSVGKVTEANLKLGEKNAIRAAVAALEFL